MDYEYQSILLAHLEPSECQISEARTRLKTFLLEDSCTNIQLTIEGFLREIMAVVKNTHKFEY